MFNLTFSFHSQALRQLLFPQTSPSDIPRTVIQESLQCIHQR